MRVCLRVLPWGGRPFPLMAMKAPPCAITQAASAVQRCGGPRKAGPAAADLSFMSGCVSRDLEKSLGFVIPAVLSHPVLMLLAASPPQPCPWPQEGEERISWLHSRQTLPFYKQALLCAATQLVYTDASWSGMQPGTALRAWGGPGMSRGRAVPAKMGKGLFCSERLFSGWPTATPAFKAARKISGAESPLLFLRVTHERRKARFSQLAIVSRALGCCILKK